MSNALYEIMGTLKDADCESTRSPYWLIVDPRQSFRCDVGDIASMITGPFFCREDAEDYLKRTRYNFGKYAKVWCASGCYSWKYDDFCKSIDKI